MRILNYTNKLFLFMSFAIFVYIIFLLVSNISSGFDITDESYYILAASHPNDIFSTVKHEGYYTEILYFLSGYNLSYFRFLGILLLIFISIWFATELHKHISKKFDYAINIWDKFLFIVPIAIGSLSFYKSWLITPSYNWLALISVIFVLLSLFRIVNNKEWNYNRYITPDYILLSFSLSLAFLAKPTTALVLTIISVLFVIYELKNIHLKKALPSVIILTNIIVVAHILILDGGFSSYYNRLIEGMERLATLGGGHTLNSRYIDMVKLIQEFFFEKFYFHQINIYYLYGIVSIIAILFMIRNKINALNFYVTLMFIVVSIYAYIMFTHGLSHDFRFMWIRSIELLLLNFIFIVIAIQFVDNKKEFSTQIIKIIPLLFIIILGSFAYKFGSNNQIIYSMSGSMIFIVASTVVLNYIFDRILNMRVFTALNGLILSVFIYYSINYAYEHPYRLITDIEGQNQNVELLGGLVVDGQTKQYIEDLQSIASKNRSNDEKISLIDMTGGSPGVNVILDADFFGFQWLAGGYQGSNQFAERVLKPYLGTDKLRKAWILVALEGRRKLDLKILNRIGLDFPENYKKIGTVKTAHRNEVQELWKPISTLK